MRCVAGPAKQLAGADGRGHATEPSVYGGTLKAGQYLGADSGTSTRTHHADGWLELGAGAEFQHPACMPVGRDGQGRAARLPCLHCM